MSALADFLAYFGINAEQPHNPAGVPLEKVESASVMTKRFESDAARQKSQSYYFNDGARISSYMEGPHGVKLPRFTMAPHLLK